MEIWDVYDIDRFKTGKTVFRGNKMEPGEYHLVVGAAVFNSEGKLLIQKRSAEKDDRANLWDITVGGAGIQGENSRDALEREIREELGIILDMTGKRPALTLNFSPGFYDFYIIREDIDINKLTFQKEEVCDAKYATEDEVLELLKKEEFSPNFLHFIGLLFEIKDVIAVGGVLRGYIGFDENI